MRLAVFGLFFCPLFFHDRVRRGFPEHRIDGLTLEVELLGVRLSGVSRVDVAQGFNCVSPTSRHLSGAQGSRVLILGERRRAFPQGWREAFACSYLSQLQHATLESMVWRRHKESITE